MRQQGMQPVGISLPHTTPFPTPLLHSSLSAAAGVKKYLDSSNRHNLVWGQDWQPARDSKDVHKMVG